MAQQQKHFADRLIAAIQNKRTPLMVGLDPRWEQLPKSLTRESLNRIPWSEQAAAFRKFCCDVIDVVAPLVAVVKPQSAFFEQLGPHGMLALSEVVDYAASKNLLVVMDAKRGDIGSTAEAYAAAFLGAKPESAWGCDALTVNPYLGDDSLTPFVNSAQQTGSGIYVLCKTSNPGSRTLQEKMIDGKPVYEIVAEQIQALAKDSMGQHGYGLVGAVVGATYPEQLAVLRSRMPNTLLLVPGFGAQGGSAKDVAGAFDAAGNGAVINSSRGIIFAQSRPEYSAIKNWQTAVEQATKDSIEELASASNG